MAKKKRRATSREADKSVAAASSSPTTHRPFALLRNRPAAPPSASDGRATPPRVNGRLTPPIVGTTSREERFSDYMAGVAKEQRGARRATLDAADAVSPLPLAEEAAIAAAKQAARDAKARAELFALVEDARFDVVDDGTVLQGRRLDVEPRIMRRLRRPTSLPIDGELDLHGMRVDEAHDAVLRFVRRRSAEGDRVVRLIHGRGQGGPYGKGVLRGEIGAWLSQGPASRLVAAFASQLDADGQSGSVLVVFAST